MQEQQINQKYCPPQNKRFEQVDNVLQGKQRSEQIANRRLKQLYRFLPQTFTPYMKIANHYSINNQQQHQSNVQQTNTIRLNNGHPQFSLNSLIYDRQRLSLQRQMMYCRGAVAEEIMDEDVVENMIKESGLQRGYVHKSGNKSVIVDGMLVYVHGEMIKAVVVPWYKCSNNNRAIQIYDQSMNPMTMYTFPTGTLILQLQLFSTNNTHQQFDSNKKTSNNNKHSSNNSNNNNHFNNNPIILSLRLSRQIVILNLSQQRIIHSIQTQANNQFISSQKYIYNVNTIQTIEYDGFDSKIRKWDLRYNNNNSNNKNHYNHNGSIQQNSQSQQSLRLKGTLIHSINKLTRNQTILATYQGLSMCDYRQKHITTLYSLININKDKTINSNDRIYSAIKISSNFTYSPYLTTCNTRHICLFDIRNFSQPIQRRLHHLQQAPPQNMTYFDGFQQRLDKGVIVGWNSWGKYSAGVMTEVNVNGFFNNSKELKQQGKREQPILGKHFQLLSPNNNSNKRQHINNSSYISSISLYNYSPQSLALISTTNQGAINMHLYHHNSIKQKYQPQQILFQQTGKQKMIKSLENNEGHSSERWLKANLCDKYFTKVVGYQKISQQSNQGEKMTKHQTATNNKKKKKAKTNSTSLVNNKDKKKKKHNSNNKSINEKISKNNIDIGKNQNVDGQLIDDQQLLLDTGEYQNEQKCEQSYSKRKLNFADLTKFYTTLKLKARQLQQQQNSAISKNNINTNNYSKNNFESSFTSTQPYSQSFSLSQSFNDDFFKTYTFHNKKVLNTSMLDQLKTQWQL